MKSIIKSKYIYFVVFTVNIVAFSTGTLMFSTSSQISKLSDIKNSPLGREITSNEESWIGSLISVGGILGPVMLGFLSSKIGKRYSVLSLAVPFAFATLTYAFAETIYLFFIARVISGIGIASTFSLVILYVAEISDTQKRGLFSSSFIIFLSLGMLYAYCVSPYTSLKVYNLTVTVFPVLFAILGIYIIPESPFYLVANGREEEAIEVLTKLREADANIKEEIQVIKDALTKNTEQASIKDMFSTKAARLAFFLSILLVVSQQFSGMAVILAYTEQIFKETNSTLTPAESSIIIGVVGFLFSPLAPMLTDKFGRRFLLLSSISGNVLMLVVIGLYFFLKDNGTNVDSISWLPIVCVVIFIFFNTFGLFSLIWPIISELLPQNVKSQGAGVMSLLSNLSGFVVTFLFPIMQDSMGLAGLFWFYGGVILVTGIYFYFKLPETRGKSMQEIQDILSS
ncbi:facilitated trehalose transporter Tret1-like [Aethina tumida]|uniref:facilitated trehalose transporter Tret1-like n=1 Tax=Aethina tumida TaxID=116153 RepID=UPI002148B1D5|nr:facilitated trehalose transporter Tret1-like [Aethina tumida]